MIRRYSVMEGKKHSSKNQFIYPAFEKSESVGEAQCRIWGTVPHFRSRGE